VIVFSNGGRRLAGLDTRYHRQQRCFARFVQCLDCPTVVARLHAFVGSLQQFAHVISVRLFELGHPGLLVCRSRILLASVQRALPSPDRAAHSYVYYNHPAEQADEIAAAEQAKAGASGPENRPTACLPNRVGQLC
jgi:hypothetical protein